MASKHNHVGVGTNTIVYVRGKKNNASQMDKHRFCNICLSYDKGKCTAGVGEPVEIEDVMYADKCRSYKQDKELWNRERQPKPFKPKKKKRKRKK